MSSLEQVRAIIGEVLQLGARSQALDSNTVLLGNLPEFDSMAVVSVITALEEQFGFVVDDDEISADTFESLGSLAAFVDQKLGQ